MIPLNKNAIFFSMALEKKKPLMLIVDDEESNLSALERLFKNDFEILKASSVKESESLLAVHEFAVVLTDYLMPQGNGVQLLRKFKDSSPATVRAIFSGQIDLEDLSKAINEGLVHRFFVKPWDNYVLKLQMQECLQMHQFLRDKNKLEIQATTDAVTGLYNHRYFKDHFHRELLRAKRHKRSLSLLMIDVDHFKQFNDQHGHPEGDRALMQIGVELSSAVRNIDTVSRYGGEEFAVILPDTKLSDALEIAERIRKQIESKFNSENQLTQGRVPLTVSLGIASFPEHGDKSQNLIERADAALYTAKKQGRNQSIIATET